MKEYEVVIEQRKSFFLENYPLVSKIYHRPYDMPELDPLRHEISLCIMFGLHQAAITLTNHLIEWFIKLILIYNESTRNNRPIDKNKSIVDNIEEHFSGGIDNYIGKDMSETINKAKSLGLITKEQWKKLDKIRQDYRNSFGHADSSKIFKDSEIGLTGLSAENNQFRSEQEISKKITNMPIIQGLLKVKFAEAHSIPYFIYVDNLIRETLLKLFPNIEDDYK
jgi:hypothetical protein